MTDTQNGGDSCWRKGTLICSPISCRKQDGADSTWQAGRVSTLPPTPSGRLGQLATVGLGQIKDKVVYWLKKKTNLPVGQETWVQCLDGGDPLEKGMAALPVPCLENPTDGGAWLQSRALQSWRQLSD